MLTIIAEVLGSIKHHFIVDSILLAFSMRLYHFYTFSLYSLFSYDCERL